MSPSASILRQSPLQRVDRNGPLQHGVVTAEHGPHRTFTQDRVDALSSELSNDRRFGHGSVVNVVFLRDIWSIRPSSDRRDRADSIGGPARRHKRRPALLPMTNSMPHASRRRTIRDAGARTLTDRVVANELAYPSSLIGSTSAEIVGDTRLRVAGRPGEPWLQPQRLLRSSVRASKGAIATASFPVASAS